MNKAKAFAISTTQVAIAPWFSYWLSLLLSRHPFLSFFAFLLGFPTAIYTSINMIERGKNYDLLSRATHQYRGWFQFEQYTEIVSTIEYTTLWTICLILGSSFTYNYLYELIPLLTGLNPQGWERIIILIFTVVFGSICVPIFTLFLNWTLTDHSVKEFEKKQHQSVLAATAFTLSKDNGGVMPAFKREGERGTRYAVSLLVISLAIGYRVNVHYGSLLALFSAHSVFNLPISIPKVARWHLYGGAALLCLAAVGVQISTQAGIVPISLSTLAITVLGALTATSHPRASTIKPLYLKFVKGGLWCTAAALWSYFSHPYPAWICVLFAVGNFLTLFPNRA